MFVSFGIGLTPAHPQGCVKSALSKLQEPALGGFLQVLHGVLA
jgi:hypothetical protein